MPNKKWGKRGQKQKLFLADGKIKAQGVHPKCKKCPVMKDCNNVLYNARNCTNFYCADNPNEGRTYPRLYKIAIDNFKRIFPEAVKEIEGEK